MDELAKLELKKKVISEQTERFWEFCKEAQDDYNDGDRVIPDSVQEFATVFFEGLEKVLRAI